MGEARKAAWKRWSGGWPGIREKSSDQLRTQGRPGLLVRKKAPDTGELSANSSHDLQMLTVHRLCTQLNLEKADTTDPHTHSLN